MSQTSNNRFPAKVVPIRANIDISSGPRDASDPRSLRATQQMMASRMAGYGLKYDEQGRLSVDTETLALLDLATDNNVDLLEQGIERLAQACALGRLYYTNTTEVTTDNTASEFTWASFKIPQNLLVGTHAVRMVGHGYLINNTGSARTFTAKVKLGGTIHWQDVSLSIAASTSPRSILWDVTYQGVTSTTQIMHGTLIVGDASTPSTGYGSFNADALCVAGFGQWAGTVDMRQAQDLEFTITPSVASSTYDFKHYGSYLIAY